MAPQFKKGGPDQENAPRLQPTTGKGITGQSTQRRPRSPVSAAIGLCVRASEGRLRDVARARAAWRRVVREDSELARRMEDAARRVRDGGRPARRDHLAPEARVWKLRALVLIAAQHSDGSTGGGRRLWAGRDREGQPDEHGRYQRASGSPSKLGGLAARLGCSVRQIGRLWAILGAVGVVQSWQPRDKGGAAPERLGKALCGRLRGGVRYAYRVIRWHCQLPREVVRVLRPPQEEPSTTEQGRAPPDRRPIGEGHDLAAALLETVLQS